MEALSRWPSQDSPPPSLAACLAPSRCKPATGRAPAPQSTRWQAAVMQPLRELGLALGTAVPALGRLLVGVAGYADYLVAGRGRVLAPLESNPP
ncbi:MAG TPA: hypothetical protein VGJ72_04440 [Polaromonas sp.]